MKKQDYFSPQCISNTYCEHGYKFEKVEVEILYSKQRRKNDERDRQHIAENRDFN